MMKKYILILTILFLAVNKCSYAHHLKGGWLQYQYISTDSVAQTNKYKITLRQYISCGQGVPRDNSLALGIFDAGTNIRVDKKYLKFDYTINLNKTTFDPCMTNPPKGQVCYVIDVLSLVVDLPFNENGYKIATQRCCRIDLIRNVAPPSDDYGITYYNTIPGKINGIWYANNSSPEFALKDTSVVCYNSPFTFDFSATDVNGDSLSYSFCNALHGGYNSSTNDPQAATPDPPLNPPYSSIAYKSPYSGISPLGMAVTINPKTGLISGIAPNDTGDYVVSVCVSEFRNKELIGITKKEIHIKVTQCTFSVADLKPTYINCNDSTFNFKNETNLPTNVTYNWNFGDGNTSTNATPKHTYADTGVYKLILIITSLGCSSIDSAIVRVFPGFIPNFSVAGFCYQNPFNFTNTTYAKYGLVDSVFWDFGVANITTDTSTKKNPPYKYGVAGTYNVHLYAHSSKGCSADTIKQVVVLDKPPITLPFRDTLICSIDTLPLLSYSTPTATYSWTSNRNPNNYISNTNIANPYVFPKDTTIYILTVTDNGCINKDYIQVNVLDFITVDAGADANVCLTDGYLMKTVSFALGYVWTPALTLDYPNKKYPTATPTQPATKYYVTANLGKCQDRDSVTLYTFPYPVAKVGRDTSICLGDSVQLLGIDTGDVFYWKPITTLTNATSLSPIAKPKKTTDYILTAQYVTGCLKPVSDTINVNVVQPFTVNVGYDTMVVFNQPLQLFAKVKEPLGKQFLWTGLNGSSTSYITTPQLQNPVLVFPNTVDSVLYQIKAYTKENCYALDTIKIKIFKTIPSIFVPTGFTPNGDGLNDIIKPICVGITQLNYFNIYNRWGKLVFTTSQIGNGWNGAIDGKFQNSGTFVYTVQGIDYLGNILTQKGTVVLIQ